MRFLLAFTVRSGPISSVYPSSRPVKATRSQTSERSSARHVRLIIFTLSKSLNSFQRRLFFLGRRILWEIVRPFLYKSQSPTIGFPMFGLREPLRHRNALSFFILRLFLIHIISDRAARRKCLTCRGKSTSCINTHYARCACRPRETHCRAGLVTLAITRQISSRVFDTKRNQK